jgi:hypothetical protein
VRFHIILIPSSLIALAAMPALAGPREDTLAGISRCAALADDRIFLECVYGAVQPLRARLGLSPAPEAQVRLVPLARSTSAQSPDRPPAVRQESNSGSVLGNLFGGTSLHMTAYSFDARGLFTVTLSNGEVWRQDANDTNYAHWNGKAANYPVTLISGEFGVSRLDVRGEPGPYRVVKVR